MGKRKRHAESRDGVDGANHKRAKVDNSASTPDAGFIDPAGSERSSKKSGNEQRDSGQASRKHDNAGRGQKYQEKQKEQSGERIEVPIQNENDNSDGRRQAEGNEHKAHSQRSRKHKNERRARKRAEKKEQSGEQSGEQSRPMLEAPVQIQDDKSEVHEPAGEKKHKAPLPESRKRRNAERARKRAEEEEMSETKNEVPVQKKNDKSDGHARTEGSERQAPQQKPRKHNNPERARKRAEEKEQSGASVEVPAQNKKDGNDKSDGHEQVEGNEHKASLPGPRKHKNERRALKHQAKEEGQSGEKAKVPTQNKERMEPAHQGEVSQKPHPEQVALIDGEPSDVPASQNVEAKRKKKHGSYFEAQRLARRAIAAAGDTIKKVDSSDQNDAQGPPATLRVHEVQETQQMPVMGKRHERDKAQKQDGKAITMSESGKEPAGKDMSKVMEPEEGHDVQRHSKKKTKSESSKKKKLNSLELEGTGPIEGGVIEASGGHDGQRHSSKEKPKSGKKGKPKSTKVREAERSIASESVLEQAVAASYPEWNVARSTGGQMLHTDPIFSKDEE